MFSILASASTETGFFESFGVDWPFFIAQLVNFILVLLVLKKFAFGPIQEILEKRRNRIAEGEAMLAEAEERLEQSEKEKEALLEKANADAKRLINEARDSATALGEQKAQEATVQAQTILTKAEEAARAERASMQADLKKEFGRLVVATTSQVTGKTLSKEDQERLNKEAAASVKD